MGGATAPHEMPLSVLRRVHQASEGRLEALATGKGILRELTRLCVLGGDGSSLVELDVLNAELFSKVVSLDTSFVTLFPTTVETVKDAPVLAIRTFYHFGAHVSLCDW